jgi:hypothetical protein
MGTIFGQIQGLLGRGLHYVKLGFACYFFAFIVNSVLNVAEHRLLWEINYDRLTLIAVGVVAVSIGLDVLGGFLRGFQNGIKLRDLISRFRGDRPQEIQKADDAADDYDYLRLVTMGHVWKARIEAVGGVAVMAATVLLVLGLVVDLLAVSTSAGSFIRLPASARHWMTYDPEHYATIPGYNELGDYRLAWLKDAAGTSQGRGLTDEAFEALFKAARDDIQAHGNDLDAYESSVLKKIDAKAFTRPEKVFSVSKDHLETTGVIALAYNRSELANLKGSKANGEDSSVPVAYVIAWVEGRLRIMILDFERGQKLNGLAATTPFLTGDAYRFIQTAQPEDLDALRPVPASKS